MKIEIKSTAMPDEPYYVYELAYPQGFIDEEGNDLSGVAFYVGKGTVVMPYRMLCKDMSSEKRPRK